MCKLLPWLMVARETKLGCVITAIRKLLDLYTKVKGHLMRLPCHNVEGCSTISDEVLEVIKKEYEAAEAKKAELALNARKKAEPLVNIMAASSGGSMFIKAIDASENTKDAEYVANLFVQTIKDLREANVVQIVTDNASNYKATGLTIETKYPHVFWTLCVVHSLNLAMKSICEPGEKSPQYTQCSMHM
ncbi:hypothetical protein Acr_12g0005020 [Actinidia rufa]|uniref:DUF659 domain-containing protein n=1 Tax=Actinidia rufa TaxID=165716 RepID=A0A7J0FH08_9ERIC|nr:hypothetical protein Acr_12g0005020 [Actinidia rufa]